ncbi:MAG TPA: Gfo/Idh/MocA family oxidoreductase [Tepidisphaeraceae bacterium]|nr:Gfo/Idh/MocA family oxidoreductase [Tepidisphaeraceae bacterium]
MTAVGVAIIGTGQIALANHLPGLKLLPGAKLVALCDSDESVLRRAAEQTGIRATFTDYNELLQHDAVDAVVIATPNITHPPIAIAAAKAGKHVMCEKPLALNLSDALAMLRAAEEANVRHMTAFTYRFVPAMRYMHHLISTGAIGGAYHFRAQRFQDWGDRGLGWRQVKALAGTGEMGDMLSHRIDYAHLLIGPIRRLVADVRTFVPTRAGNPSDVDDWVAMLADFGERDVTGVLESTKLATGRGEGLRGQDTVEVNGSEGTIVYSTQKPLELQIGKKGDPDLHRIDVPREFLVHPKSPRDASLGDPLVTFRYDQTAEFIDAIVNQRQCSPSFVDGARAQGVMDVALQSAEQRCWMDVPQVT